MTNQNHPKKLLVEGPDDKHVVPPLMEANGVAWPDKHRPVEIRTFDGLPKLLKPGVIEALLKSSGTRIVGIVVDADENAQTRYQEIRARCIGVFPELDPILPSTGVIKTHNELKLGIWIMPNNEAKGMLETFLLTLASSTQSQLVRYAREACERARSLGANYKNVQMDKAHIRTWLAWQDEPGALFGTAIKSGSLDPKSSEATAFVAWFRNLFEF